MDSIVASLYGLGPTGPSKKSEKDRGYYSSFGYWQDVKDGNPPPPASEGGPTAQEIMEHEGLLDDNGYLKSNPGTHSIVAAMYGGAPQPINPGNNAMNPNYNAAATNSTVGGIGNTDGWGNKIYWSPPVGGQLTEGEQFTTPAGTYTVGTNPWGQYVLIPEAGASQGTGPYVTNLTHGQHHVGINPQTGEVWYQKSAGAYDYSGGGTSYTQTEGSPEAPNNPNNGGGNNGGGNNGGNNGGGNNGGGTNGGGSNAAGKQSSWLDVLGRGGKDIENWDPFMQIFGNDEPPDWTSMSIDEVQKYFDELPNGLFSGMDRGAVYQRLLENLGLV